METQHIHDHSRPINKKLQTQVQYVQLRTGYVSDQGQMVVPRTTFRMKTAIEPDFEVAAEAQLFGYGAIEAGQQFRGYLEIDEQEHEDSDELSKLSLLIIQALSDRPRVGRSRSSQYGSIDCVCVEEKCDKTQIKPNDDTLVALCVSDLALRDEWGTPTLVPTSQQFGLPDHYEVDYQRSFLRFKRYSPYNAKRRSPDQERQVILQGSVIAFSSNSNDNNNNVSLSQSIGVGDYQYAGLGSVLFNPNILDLPAGSAKDTPARDSEIDPAGSVAENTSTSIYSTLTDVSNALCDKDAASVEHDALVTWLHTQVEESEHQKAAQAEAERMLGELRTLYQAAQSYNTVLEHSWIGPTRSQWNRAHSAAKHQPPEELSLRVKELIGMDAHSGVVTDPDWSVETGLSGHKATFGQWLLEQVNTQTSGKHSEPIALLCRFTLDLLKELEAPGEKADGSESHA